MYKMNATNAINVSIAICETEINSIFLQHNVKISTTKAADGDKKNKLEPLFMAISGFLGMAVMFVLSVLVLPKFGIKQHKPKGKQELGDIARIALQAIEGQDCRERFACELSKTARSLNLQENRFVK